MTKFNLEKPFDVAACGDGDATPLAAHPEIMNPPPSHIDGHRVLRYVILDSHHSYTGFTQYFDDKGKIQLPSVALAICEDAEVEGLYQLLHCDETWSLIADMPCNSLDEALEQAEWEVRGVAKTWNVVS